MLDLIVMGEIPGTQIEITFEMAMSALAILFGGIIFSICIKKLQIKRRSSVTSFDKVSI